MGFWCVITVDESFSSCPTTILWACCIFAKQHLMSPLLKWVLTLSYAIILKYNSPFRWFVWFLYAEFRVRVVFYFEISTISILGTKESIYFVPLFGPSVHFCHYCYECWSFFSASLCSERYRWWRTIIWAQKLNKGVRIKVRSWWKLCTKKWSERKFLTLGMIEHWCRNSRKLLYSLIKSCHRRECEHITFDWAII